MVMLRRCDQGQQYTVAISLGGQTESTDSDPDSVGRSNPAWIAPVKVCQFTIEYVEPENEKQPSAAHGMRFAVAILRPDLLPTGSHHNSRGDGFCLPKLSDASRQRAAGPSLRYCD